MISNMQNFSFHNKTKINLINVDFHSPVSMALLSFVTGSPSAALLSSPPGMITGTSMWGTKFCECSAGDMSDELLSSSPKFTTPGETCEVKTGGTELSSDWSESVR